MKPTLAHPSWSQIDKACALLSNKILRKSFTHDDQPEAIVGLARGGLIPAVIISHILELKVFPVSYSSKQGNGEYREYQNVLPEIPFKNILIIDDIVDSGHTMKEVVEGYKALDYKVTTAALYYKDGSVFKPEFSWQHIPYDAGWTTFPWEL